MLGAKHAGVTRRAGCGLGVVGVGARHLNRTGRVVIGVGAVGKPDEHAVVLRGRVPGVGVTTRSKTAGLGGGLDSLGAVVVAAAERAARSVLMEFVEVVARVAAVRHRRAARRRAHLGDRRRVRGVTLVLHDRAVVARRAGVGARGVGHDALDRGVLVVAVGARE